MRTTPDLWWPVVALAVVCAADAVMCLEPMAFIRACMEDVRFPARWWWTLPVVKSAAAAGLVAGLWVPALGAVTCCALVLYFVLAIGAHIRARDFGRNLFLNASGMLASCVAVTVACFVV